MSYRLESALDDLADLLGDDHDLAVLEQEVLEGGLVEPQSEAGRHLAAAIAAHRERCQHGAWPIAERIFAERRKHFVRCIRGYWVAATRRVACSREKLRRAGPGPSAPVPLSRS